MKPVRAIAKAVRGVQMYRIIIPKRLTGGKRKTKWFRSKSKAEDFARAVENERMSKIHFQFNEEERSKVLACINRLGGIEALCRATDFWILHRALNVRTVSEMVEACRRSKAQAERSKKYLENFASVTRQFEKTFGKMDCQAITPAHIKSWLHSRRLAADTKRGYLKDIRTLFSFALKEEKCVTSNPAMEVPMPSRKLESPIIHSVEEVERVMRAAEQNDRCLIPYLALGYFGGLRPWEAAAITRAEIRSGHIEVKAARSKGRKRRLVTINETLAEWFKVSASERIPAVNLRRRLKRIRHLARLKDDPERIALKWGHDILRHSFASYSYPIYGAAATAREAGHSEAILFQHYRELVTRQDAEKFWSIKPVIK